MQRPREESEKEICNTTQIFKVVKAESGLHGQRGRTGNEQVNAPLNTAAKSALENAGYAAFMSLPVITAQGLIMLAVRRGEFSSIMNVMGVPVTIGGFVLDAIKWPFFLAYATEELARAGLTKIASTIIEGTPEHEFEKRMLESFLIRLMQTAKLLCALGFDEPKAMQDKLESGHFDDLMGLTLLHTAFASRHAMTNSLLLANGNILTQENCPQLGRALFDKCIEAKQIIVEALGGPPGRIDDELYMRESRIVSRWIPYIRAGKMVELNDIPDADPKSIALLNRLIALIVPLSMHANAVLPVEASQVGRSAIGFQRK